MSVEGKAGQLEGFVTTAWKMFELATEMNAAFLFTSLKLVR